MLTDLKPVYDTAKSFYGKALVNDIGGGRVYLYSYDRKVCFLDTITGEYTLLGSNNTWEGPVFTKTTQRHIKEFLRQNGYPAMTWKETVNGAAGLYDCGKWIKRSKLRTA